MKMNHASAWSICGEKLFQVLLVFKKMQADYECAASQTRNEVKLLHAWVDPSGFRRSGAFG